MIKLLTFTMSGSAYLNFMGNEFAHPNVRFFYIVLSCAGCLHFSL